MNTPYTASLPLLRRILRAFGADLWQQRRPLLLAYTCTLLSVAALVLAPWPLKFIIDDILVERAAPAWAEGLSLPALVVALTGLAIVLAWARAQFVAWESLLNARVNEQLMRRMRERGLAQLQRLSGSLRTDLDQRSGELVLRIVDDVRFVARMLTRAAPQAVQFGVSALVTLAIMSWMDWRLGLLAAAITAAITWLATRYARPMRKSSQAKRRAEGQVAGFAQEAMGGLAAAQLQNQEAHIQRRFAEINRASLAAGVEEVKVAAGMERSLQTAKGTAMAVITAAGGLLVLQDAISLGSLTVFIAYMTQLMRPVEKINSLASSVVKGLTRGEQLLELLALKPSVSERVDAVEPVRVRGQIEFRQVSFAYPGRSGSDTRPALADVSFVIPAGTTCALVGPSGSGKSTLLALLLRLYDPDRGQVLLDGTPIDGLRLDALRRQFAVMLQDVHLFAGSVREALSMGLDCDDARIWQALEQVAMAETVAAMPAGLDSPLGESAVNLSGGQRARLALSRIFLLDRPVIVLDEPTANVDDESCRIILDALDRISRNRTCIVVTHQSEVMNWARQRIRIQAGRMLADAA